MHVSVLSDDVLYGEGDPAIYDKSVGRTGVPSSHDTDISASELDQTGKLLLHKGRFQNCHT